MKKMVLVIALAALAIAGSAFAQGEYTNNLGVYLDESATENCGNQPESTPFNAYLVVTNLTLPAIDSLEFKLEMSGQAFMTDLTFRGQHIDAGPGTGRPGEHIVGWVTPFSKSPAMVVADLQFIITDASVPLELRIYPVLFSSLSPGPGLPGPPVVGTAGDLAAAHPAFASGINGSYDDPVFIVNGECMVVAEETDTWGSVKSLYR